jgi:hypothetical protein
VMNYENSANPGVYLKPEVATRTALTKLRLASVSIRLPGICACKNA